MHPLPEDEEIAQVTRSKGEKTLSPIPRSNLDPSMGSQTPIIR